jgi:hypothetical protein
MRPSIANHPRPSASPPFSKATNCLTPAPPSPPPTPNTIHPPPLRQPETLGTLITIRDSPGRGKGVFALIDIPRRTVLLAESPLVTLIDTGTRADPLDSAVAELSPAARASFFSLHHHASGGRESRSRAIVYSNGYSIRDDLATGVFETASRINHSCVPNASYTWVARGKDGVGRMVFWSRDGIRGGEEVLVDYGHRREVLKRIYGFECDCGGCRDEGGGAGDERERKGKEIWLTGVEEGMESLDLARE